MPKGRDLDTGPIEKEGNLMKNSDSEEEEENEDNVASLAFDIWCSSPGKEEQNQISTNPSEAAAPNTEFQPLGEEFDFSQPSEPRLIEFFPSSESLREEFDFGLPSEPRLIEFFPSSESNSRDDNKGNEFVRATFLFEEQLCLSNIENNTLTVTSGTAKRHFLENSGTENEVNLLLTDSRNTNWHMKLLIPQDSSTEWVITGWKDFFAAQNSEDFYLISFYIPSCPDHNKHYLIDSRKIQRYESMQMEKLRRLQNQPELRIDVQGGYMNTMLKRACQTLGGVPNNMASEREGHKGRDTNSGKSPIILSDDAFIGSTYEGNETAAGHSPVNSSLEEHASSSSKPTVSAHGKAPGILTTEEPGIEIELGGIPTHREGKEPLEEQEHASSGICTPKEGEDPLEEHASSSSKPTVSAHGKAPEISTTEEPGIEIELGSLLFSGSPTKVGDKMVYFLFEVLVTRGDVTRGTLLIPVEAALQYFPSPAHLQTYQENINMQHISDTPPILWLMFLSYDKSECCYVVDGIWQTIVSYYHLFVGDVIRFYRPSRVWENNSFLFDIGIRRYSEIKAENLLFQLPLTKEGIQCKSLFIPAEEVSNHFPAVGIPAAETHHMERLYFTDVRLRQHCFKIVWCPGIFQLKMEEFFNDFNLGEGDRIRFYKADLQPSMNKRHFLIGFVKGCGDPTESGPAVSYNTDPGGDDREGDGGRRSGGRKWWKFGCCMA